MRVSLDDTSAHRSLLAAGWSVQKCVCQSTLDTTGGQGNRPLQGFAPWQARSHGHAQAPSHWVYPLYRASWTLGGKICLKISASKLGGGVSPLYVSRIQYGIATCAVCLPFCPFRFRLTYCASTLESALLNVNNNLTIVHIILHCPKK